MNGTLDRAGNFISHEEENRALRQTLYEKFGENANLQKIQDQLVEDLEKALNFIVAYQRCLRILRSPDPNFTLVRPLLSKYKIVGVEPAGGYKIYADGVDITLHPDSIEASVVDETVEGEIVTREVPMLDLPEDEQWKHEQGTDIAELVADEYGNMRLRPIASATTRYVKLEDEEGEDKGELDPASRNWLTEGDDDATDRPLLS